MLKIKLKKIQIIISGKSAEDLIEMQQDNINNLLKPEKYIPYEFIFFSYSLECYLQYYKFFKIFF